MSSELNRILIRVVFQVEYEQSDKRQGSRQLLGYADPRQDFSAKCMEYGRDHPESRLD